MNDYEAKQEAKRARLEALAAKATEQSAMTYTRAKAMGEAIPLGQPILIGHHSEKRDRNYRAKIHNTFGKSFALADKAEYFMRRAEAVGTGGISSDDPDAIAKLKAEYQEMETNHKLMIKANALIRKNDRDGLAKLGYAEDDVKRLFGANVTRTVGFPSYRLTNHNANMKRVLGRIKVLETLAKRVESKIEAETYTYSEDKAENRVMFFFEGKPDESTRTTLKRHGFKWSPTRGAWVRQLSISGINAAADVRKILNAQTKAKTC
jgi:hypothetical protein